MTVEVLSKVIAFLRSPRSDSQGDALEEDLLNDCLGLYVAVADLKKQVQFLPSIIWSKKLNWFAESKISTRTIFSQESWREHVRNYYISITPNKENLTFPTFRLQ